MTIDEHIGVIEDLKSTMNVCMPEPEKTEICTSLSAAIDTMRKYQKIEDIYYHQKGFALENSLREVIEDGNDD
mgnify:CR=1 FL=1